MLKINIIAVCAFILTLNGVNGRNVDDKIIGGIIAPEGAAPYMVSLMNSNHNHICGACILNHRWVLTAAHCLNNPDTNIMAGSNHLDRPNVFIKAIRRIPHPDHDIGLVQTEKDIPYSTLVQPVALPSQNLADDSFLRLTGWGAIKYENGAATGTTTLKLLDTYSISQTECSKHYPNITFDKDLCTFKSLGNGACYGDSGSPYVNNVGRVHAVVSRVAPCAKGYPDINTRVFTHLAWINSYINSY